MYYQNDTYVGAQRTNGSWAYVNGELYHYGRPGMSWGKHLPGTDWWKVAKNSYSNYMNRNTTQNRTTYTDANGRERSVTTSNRPSRLQGIGYAAKAVGTLARNQVRNAARVANENAKADAYERISSSYVQNRLANRHNMKAASVNGTTHLDELSNRLIESGNKYYQAMSGDNTGGWKDILNFAVRNAGFNIVNGVNQFLKKRGWDKKVDQFLSKILGKKSQANSNNYVKKGGQLGAGNTKSSHRTMSVSAEQRGEAVQRVQNSKVNSGYNRAESQQMGTGAKSQKTTLYNLYNPVVGFTKYPKRK